MRLGVDYYPEHWDESRWPIDAKLMREAGISIVRLAEFAWCKMEPREGQFDFTWLDRAITILNKEGIQVILGTPTATPPAWLHEKYPDIYPVDSRKYRLGFGTRLQRCMSHPEMRKYSRLITEKMVTQYVNNPVVVGWQIDNEFDANQCFCEICADHFHEWLRKKYETLDNLNKKWGTIFWSQEYSNWNQIPLPWVVRCGQAHNPSLWMDYRRFASETTVSFSHEQVEIIRRLSPHQFITHNFMGLHDSMDYFKLAEDMDFVAWDNYPGGTWHPGTGKSQSIAHDVMRGLKQKNYWLMEEQSNIPGWDRMGTRPNDGLVRAWSWQGIGHGADTIVFFRWRSCLYGTEQYWHGILNHDGKPRRRYKEISQLGKEIQNLSNVLDQTIVSNEVAILNSYEENWSLQIQPQTDGLSWWEQTRRFHDPLTHLGVNSDIIPISVDLHKYKILIVPSWYILTQQDADRLTEFARQGGTLILNPRTGVKTEYNTCHPLALPSLLSETAGLEIDDYDALGKLTNHIEFPTGEEYSVSTWADALLLHQAEVVATYADGNFKGEPAIARNKFGNGIVYTFGTYGEPDFYYHILKKILSESGMIRLEGIPENIDAAWRVNEKSKFLFLVNLTGKSTRMSLSGNPKTILGQPVDNDLVEIPPFEVGIYRFNR